MHAFLLLGNENAVSAQIEELAQKATKFEFPLSKIEEVRELNNFTKLKVTEKTAIVIRDFDKATLVAQNAFLKSLEEPQENLSYILTADDIQNILATIVSRCEVLEFSSFNLELSDEEKGKFDSFINGKIGDRFLITSKINKRDEAINFMRGLIAIGHKRFLDNTAMLNFMEVANETLRNLEVNGNVILQLTNFLVNMS